MVLEEILAWKRREVKERLGGASRESLQERCAQSRRSFLEAIRRSAPAFILELKHASPSSGRLVEASRREAVLSAYAPHADAVSVVTDTRFFEGSLEDLDRARGLTDLPVLCKDFILEPVQVAEARLHGADAVLLILSALNDDAWRDCAATARCLGMDVLTEIHDEDEARRAVDLGAALIGINSRNLRTLRIDRDTVARLAPRIPRDRAVVAESGIRCRGDVLALRAHADAFLVGTSLLRDPDLEAAVRHLVYGMTKICGLTLPEDAAAAWEAGATHGGLIFVASSPRHLSLRQAARIREASPLRWTGVFADEEPAHIAGAVQSLDLSAVQLHGEESPERIARLRSALPEGCEIWKAVRVRDRIPGIPPHGADRMLLDAWCPARRGGTGRAFDWSLLEDLPHREGLILSGGLHPGNAARAAATGVTGLDVCSGVERAPGEKDRDRLERFLRARRRLPGRSGACGVSQFGRPGETP